MDFSGQSSGSPSWSSVDAVGVRMGERVVRHCKKDAVILKSWTHENPGRRFYRCPQYQTPAQCRFFQWYDKERVVGWPKDALNQAHQKIQERNSELRWSRGRLEAVEKESKMVELNSTSESSVRDEIKALEYDIDRWKEERAMLKSEITHLKRQCKMLKKKKTMLVVALLLSWFIFAFAVMCAPDLYE